MSETEKNIWRISQDGTGNVYFKKSTFDNKAITIGSPIEGKKGYDPKIEDDKQIFQFKSEIKIGDYAFCCKVV